LHLLFVDAAVSCVGDAGFVFHHRISDLFDNISEGKYLLLAEKELELPMAVDDSVKRLEKVLANFRVVDVSIFEYEDFAQRFFVHFFHAFKARRGQKLFR
jgi:hypothetical protein